MSSLLQFGGRIERKGVGLLMYLENKNLGTLEDKEPLLCPTCGKTHAQLYEVFRKPVGMWGCWVVFRYLGEEHVPDLSVPIGVPSLPRGASAVDADRAAKYWHSTH